LFLANGLGLALDFPGPTPGLAREAKAGDKFTLSNDLFSFTWEVKGEDLHLLTFHDGLTPPMDFAKAAKLFQIETEKGTPQLILSGRPKFFVLNPVPGALRASQRIAGKGLSAIFQDKETGITVEWSAELRNGSNYLRQTIRVSGANAVLRKVVLNDFLASGAQVCGTVPGSPVIANGAFFGLEMPLAQAKMDATGFRFDLDCQLPLQEKEPYEFSSVCGVFPPGQMRRAFLYYLERERARPYAPFLHYNCWFDLGRDVTADGMLASINAFHSELTEKRHVPVNSYVVDDGWDNPQEGFWTIDQKKFPSGFAPLSQLLREDGSHLGLWISPLAGYDGKEQRIAQARKLGLVKGEELDLSDPDYYIWFRNLCARFIREDQVNYFKWDKAGDGITPHFMALLRCAAELREIDPGLFFNVTVGTWPSPFWLRYIDSTWRGGNDVGQEGKGNEREKYLTYRDAQSHRCMFKNGPLYPLNSLMTHGVVFANRQPMGNPQATPGDELRHDVRIYFGMGADLQELYLQPDWMKAEDWDVVAEAASWARRNADVLVDSHWIGGNPETLEPYGFASWSPTKATLAIRNPDDQPRDISLDAAQIWELPTDSAPQWSLKSPYQDQRIHDLKLKAGMPETLHLQPFEVLVFDAVPAS
jgi:hypothetical protein